MKEKCRIYDFNDEIIDIEDLLNDIERMCYYSTYDEVKLKQEITFIIDKILLHLDRVEQAFDENNEIYEEEIDALEAEISEQDEINNELKGGK